MTQLSLLRARPLPLTPADRVRARALRSLIAAAHLEALTRELDELRRRAALGGGR